MEILAEEEIDFLEADSFRGLKLIVVSDEFICTKGGAKHRRARGYAKGNAYCYDEITVRKKSK